MNVPEPTPTLKQEATPSRWPLPVSILSSALGHGLLLVTFAVAQVASSSLALTPTDTARLVICETITLPEAFMKPVKVAARSAPAPEAARSVPEPVPAPEAAPAPPTPRRARPRTVPPPMAKPVLPPQPDPKAETAPAPEIASETPDTIVTVQKTSDQITDSASTDSGAPSGPTAAGFKGGMGAGVSSPEGGGPDTRGMLKGYMSQIASQLRQARTYPQAARRAGLQGTVIVELVINSSGAIVKARVAQSSGHSILDDAAIASVRSVGHLPKPPQELKWSQRSVRIPFNYILKHS